MSTLKKPEDKATVKIIEEMQWKGWNQKYDTIPIWQEFIKFEIQNYDNY